MSSQVITGLWTAADGTRTECGLVSRRWSRPHRRGAPSRPEHLDARASAGDFVALVGAEHDAAAVDDRSTDYVVVSTSSLSSTGVIKPR
jgi:hypothetical protein